MKQTCSSPHPKGMLSMDLLVFITAIAAAICVIVALKKGAFDQARDNSTPAETPTTPVDPK